MNKRFLFLTALLLTITIGVNAQRRTDKLDRGLIAIQTTGGVYCSWRILGEEYYDVTYNLYRDGTKVASNLNISNYTDAGGSTSSKYTVKAVVRGTEQTIASKEATVWSQGYLEITPQHEGLKSTYVPNDACCADVDGDGELEIILKYDNADEISQSYPKLGPTINGVATNEYSLFECLKLDGTRLWYVNCGPNMGDFQNNEQNMVAYDWDQDGKAEAIMRAADGTTIVDKNGVTHTIGDASINYRTATGGGTNWFMHDGAEYLVYLNGETGEPYQVIEYPLKRLESGETDLKAAWGDGYGHRSTKHFFGAPYLDGRKPSIFLARGIYTRHKMIALDVNPSTHELTERWRWNCNTAGSPWYGQGYHNYAVADVDWDGRDEICFGAMVIDDNGKGLSTTGLGHGDAQHHSDFNPYKHGHEIFVCMEDNPGNNYRDATTSKIYHRYVSAKDDGRCIAGNFSNEYPGAMGFSGYDNPISCVTGDYISGLEKGGIPDNMRIYWDGDLCDEGFNYINGKNTAGGIYKHGQGRIATLEGSLTNNDTKGTPCYLGDLFGDWREEVMMRTADNKIRIYTTTTPTEWRNYTLWHDMQYRNAMVWQMCGYNQPPHVSYFLGELEGITMAPPALTMTDRTEIANGGSISTSNNDQQVLLAETQDATVSVADGSAPYIFFDNAPSWVQGNDDNDNIKYEYYTHTLTGGAFTGSMRLVKQGDGTLVLPNVTETYTGNTDVWAGTLQFDGTMESSPVWLNRHTNLISNGGNFKGGIKADYNATIYPGGKENAGTITTSTLALGFGSRVVFDVNSDGTGDKMSINTLTIEKKDWQYGPEYAAPVFEIVQHVTNGNVIPEGKYLLAEVQSVSGNISDIVIEGADGLKASLTYEDGKLYFVVEDLRDATDIYWNGASDVWDFATTKSFKLKDGNTDVFVTGDNVHFGDDATSTNVSITGNVYPNSILFENSKDYTLGGDGSIGGNITMTKDGTGNTSILNTNKFTGTITLNEGTLTVGSLADNEGTEYGSLGGSSNNIKMNGGTLAINSDMSTSQPIVLSQNGGVVDVSSKTLTLKGAITRGGANINSALHKQGNGTLNLGTGNKFSALYVDAGTVNINESNSVMSVPDTIVFSGQNVKVIDKNDFYSYSSNNANYKVPEGASGTLYLDGRCNYTGKLSGKGTLTVYATNVRNYLNGNWSAFEGTLVANHSGSSYEFSWNNSYGLPKATLNIASGTTFTCSKSALTLGNLSGSGSLYMTGNLTVGGTNQDMVFNGTLDGKVNVFKEGTGSWTFSKATAANEYVFKNGKIQLNNTKLTTSLFGSATATVQDNAELIGIGKVGNIRFLNGAVLQPGSYTTDRRYGAIGSTGFMYMYAGSKLNLIIFSNSGNQYSRSYITVGGELQLNGEINIELGEGFVPASGDSFSMWTAGSISGTPSAINLPALPDGLYWDTTELLTTTGTLRVTNQPTGISSIYTEGQQDGKTYTLGGVVVDKPTKKGIYIRNGKKIVIK